MRPEKSIDSSFTLQPNHGLVFPRNNAGQQKNNQRIIKILGSPRYLAESLCALEIMISRSLFSVIQPQVAKVVKSSQATYKGVGLS